MAIKVIPTVGTVICNFVAVHGYVYSVGLTRNFGARGYEFRDVGVYLIRDKCQVFVLMQDDKRCLFPERIGILPSSTRIHFLLLRNRSGRETS